MNKEKALKNQGLEFREDIFFPGGGTLWAVELFPFRRDTLAWAGLRGGKALGVTKPAFPPRAPPFRARRCSTLWYGVVYW